MKYVPKRLPDDVNVSPTNHLAELALLASALVALLVGGFWLLGRGADWLSDRMSPELEARLGERFHLGGDGGPELARERALLDRLLAHAPPTPYRFGLTAVCSGDDVNAVALPGGRILVLSGLLSTVKSENELAFVLAHELGHFYHRDHLHALGRGLLWMTLLTTIGAGGDFAAEIVRDSGTLVSMRFSQAQELAADAFAAELVHATWGHVGGATDFFERPALDDGGGWLSTHPASARRTARLRALFAEKGWPTGPVEPYAPADSSCASRGGK